MRVIIDTNVYKSASGKRDAPHEAKQCREILDSIYENKHQIVMSKELKKEYRDHYSYYGFDWYASLSREDRIISPKNYYNPVLRTKIQYGVCFLHLDKGKEKIIHCWSEINDDFHLIEVAIMTDNFIISNECHCYEHLSELNTVPNYIDLSDELGSLLWVIPNSGEKTFKQLIDHLSNIAIVLDIWYVFKNRK